MEGRTPLGHSSVADVAPPPGWPVTSTVTEPEPGDSQVLTFFILRQQRFGGSNLRIVSSDLFDSIGPNLLLILHLQIIPSYLLVSKNTHYNNLIKRSIK